ncbi:C40 family peptidase [Streptomyces sp. TRM 70351]|uniref:C40 family peptidase n=1 Tax=Streptomyces sp. TRM 70351 TaxID=3116552 RepID=UPI002E7BA3BF|nr:C40 family peptidase [Streptomyces sp. TRM 70351]MEE1931378.1 C40 family peptidase [Streptomyces sp. TRM 70351]
MCAVGVLALLAGTAQAAPVDPGPPGSSSGSPATTSPDLTLPPGARETARLEEVRQRIEALHDQAGSATDAYNAAAEKVERQERRMAALTGRLASNRSELDDLNDRAGAMARAQYRGGGLPTGTRLVLDDDPESFLSSLSLLLKGQQATAGILGRLSRTQEVLGADARRAHEEWTKLEAGREKQAAAREKVEDRLAAAETLESQLAADERERLRELEERAARARQTRWLGTGVLDGAGGAASERGKKAIAYATAQIGKDYEWGATGPGTFDCSGLTLRAWEAAGTPIPRTSQEQWKQLDRVEVNDMRPGDLIIYKDDASHVGMYLGDGEMVHAPRTGRQIRIEGAGALPILGVVRPDA